ncbi:MAG: CotH kinase family protein [Saprospiraceae bacterium]|nr:CotH kinase family protein [Saprospiraceae bacterium]
MYRKNYHITCILWGLTVCASYAQTVNFVSSNLPIVRIQTNGQFIPDDPRIIVQMQIIDNGPGAINYRTDPPLGYNGWISIETRGSTSQFYYPKKSYGLSTIAGQNNPTQTDVSLLGFPEENDWVLYAPYPDKTLIRNALAFDLARKTGHYASRVRFVELLLNEEYMGVYCLQEKVKRDSARVRVSKLKPTDTEGDQLTGGYILKIDKITGNTGPGWNSTLDPLLFFLHHYPDEEDLAPQQAAYIRDFVNAFDAALMTGDPQDTINGYRHFIDPGSFADFLILQELGRTVDGFRSSTFFYKDRDSKGGRLHMGPIWDFNLSFGNANYCGAQAVAGWQHTQNDLCSGYYPHVPLWWGKLLEDPWFEALVKCRWTQLRSSVFQPDSINSIVDGYVAELNTPQQRNFTRWPILGVYVEWNSFIGQTYASEITYLKDWIADRIAWMDTQWLTTDDCLVGTGSPASPVFRLFPNPAHDRLWIEWMQEGEKNVRILDARGRALVCRSASDYRIQIDCAQWPAGVYFFEIQDRTGRGIRGKFCLN